MLRRLAQAIRWFLLILLVPVAAWSLVACESPLDPPLPDGARVFAVPAVFDVWWSMTRECSGSSVLVSSVQWFVVPGVTEFAHEGRGVNGYWSRGGNRIVLAEGATLDGALVRHEMLHALERSGGHSRHAFLERCGGVVVCIDACIRDAGRPPVPGTAVRRVAADAMVVDVDLNPKEPGFSVNGGHFTVTVTVRNPGRDSVEVVLPPSGDAAPPSSFSFDVSSATIGVWFADRAWDPGVTLFAPGQTHRAVFDFRVTPAFDGGRGIPPGTYGLRGRFGDAASSARSLVVSE